MVFWLEALNIKLLVQLQTNVYDVRRPFFTEFTSCPENMFSQIQKGLTYYVLIHNIP